MAARINKLIVTNRKALKSKYGTKTASIEAALKKLISADKQRGLKTVVVALDNAATMRKYKGKSVKKAEDPKQNKAAIDAVYQALLPDYLLILGSIDVVPHQDLRNPLYDPDPTHDGDPDEFAYGDLPYACEHPYSQKIEDFTGPTRVVGRLPDLTGGKDPKYLVKLLDTAANFQSRPKAEYMAYLGISASVWSRSTKESVENIFGKSSDLQTSPAKGPNWSAALLSRRSHFVNCHGAPADFRYYGQRGNAFPDAHDASLVDGRLAEGTVAAAECCYGAELYDPAATNGRAGMCNTYLASKAYAFLGSSTIAYGPASGNGAADLITQYFLKHVLSGASTGRAALQARQDFVLHASIVDPVDLKTLAQFSLMGDPAVHPVERAPSNLIATTRQAKGLAPSLLQRVSGLALRRDTLIKNGLAIAAAANVAVASKELTVSKNVRTILQDAMKGARAVKFASFAVASPAPSAPRGMKAMALRTAAPATIHLAVGRVDSDAAPTRQLMAVVAREQEGAISVRSLVSR